jgi:hypothetical protein
MTWPQVTAVVLVLMLVGYLVYDLLALAFGGTEATISSVLLDWTERRKGIAFLAGLAIGLLLGHLFLPQRV